MPARGADGRFISIGVRADGSQARREIARTVGSARKAFGGLAAAAGLSAGIAGVIGLGKASVAVEKEFSQNMALIGAATNAPAKELDKLSGLAIKLGADTSFSANEAADAMLELAKSGLSPATIQAGALEGTLTLAAAGGTDLATAATVASNALNTFGLKGKDMASVAAALAGGANASSASVESLAQGLSQVGPGAKNAGLSLQETVATLSAFDAAGIKGSDAGTSLKTMLSRLVPQTTKARNAMKDLGLDFTNADGSFKSIEQVAGLLQERMGKLSQEQRTTALTTIFGSDATRAASVLIDQGAGGLRKYIKATKDQGAAQKLAEARMSGTAGALERLSGAAETAQLRIGQALAPAVVVAADAIGDRLVPAAEDAIKAGGSLIKAYKADGLDGVIDRVDKLVGAQGRLSPILDEGKDAVEALWRIVKQLAPAVLDAANNMSVLVSPLGLVGDVAGLVADVLEALPDGVLTLGIQAGAAALILPRLAAAVTGVGGAMAGATARTLSFTAALRATGTAAQSRAFAQLGGAAKQAAGIGGILALTAGLSEVSKEGTTAKGVMYGVAGGAGIGAMFGPIGALVGAGVGGGLVALKGALAETAEEAAEAQRQLRKTQGFQDAKDDADRLAEALNGVVNSYGNTTRAAVEADFFKDGKLEGDVKRLRELGVSMDTIVSATLGQADAQEIVNNRLTGYTRTQQRQLDAAKKVQSTITASVRNDGADKNGAFRAFTAEEQAQIDASAAAIGRLTPELKALTDEQANFAARIGDTSGAITEHQAKVQGLRADLGLTAQQYNAFPKSVRTRIESDGLPETSQGALRLIKDYKGLQRFDRISTLVTAPGVDLSRRQINKLAKTYSLTPKQVRTLIRLENINPTVRNAKQVDETIRRIGKVPPDFRQTRRSFASFYRDAEGIVSRGGVSVNAKLRDGTKKARPEFAPFNRAVTPALAPAKVAATSGGLSVGNNLEEGVIVGFAGTQQRLSTAAYNAVAAAIAAGNRAGKIRSPSRETRYTGEMLGKGLADGMDARKTAAKKSGGDLVAAALAGVTAGSDGVSKALDGLTRLIEKRIDLKDAGKERAREKAVLKGLRDEYAALRKIAKQKDALTSGNYLQYLGKESALYKAATKAGVKNLNEARDRYKQLVQASKEYAATVKAGFVTYGSVVGLGTLGDGPEITSDRIVSQLDARLAAAKRFAALIKQLSGSLNKTSLQQLIDAGIDGGGLSTAEAIAAGGSSAVTQINSLTQEIAAAGGGLGDAMATHFNQAGIDAAAGLVRGLESQQKKLDRIAERMANALAKAVKKALGIKSPSRVFKTIGKQTVDGLALGLDETYVKRQGAGLAKALQTGYASPRLNDVSLSGNASSGGMSVTLNVNVNAGVGSSPVAIGREVVNSVDAYFAAGGKTKVRWS